MSGPFPIHPEMQVLLAARSRQPKPASIAQDRAAWTRYTRALSRPRPPDLRVDDLRARTECGEVPVRIYTPARRAHPAPCIVYLHGGGFVRGDLDSYDDIAWGLAQGTGAVVVSVDYRLAPEHPYPAPFDDCYGVLCWLGSEAAHARGLDPRRLAVAGDSAGGLLTATLCLAARDRGGPPIVAQAMIYPWCLYQPMGQSYLEFADAPGIGTQGTLACRDHYLAAGKYAHEPYALPLNARDFTRLPPALIHTAQIDPVRDDGRIYATTLIQAGTCVTYREAAGMIHGFMRARFAGPAARAEFEFICAFLKSHL